MRLPCALASLCCLAGFSAAGQSVISVNSGVINYSEGSVLIDNTKLQQKFGTYPSVQTGSGLRTEDGRVEVLLTPGMILRLDHDSSVRMQSNSLADTKVEFLKGSAIVDSANSEQGKAAMIKYAANEIRFCQPGVYRLDSEPATLQVYSGAVEITAEGKKTSIDASHLYFLDAALDTPKYDDGTQDEFYRWAHNRGETILADNRLANQTKDDPSDPDIADSDDDDDDVLSQVLPGLGGSLPGYAYPGINPPLPSPIPSLGSSLGYTYPSYGALNYGALDPYSGLNPFSIFGVLPRTAVPVYILPHLYRRVLQPPSVAQTQQYWRDRIRQHQVIQTHVWQYGSKSPWPVNATGLTRPYTPSYAAPHIYVPRTAAGVPRAATPSVLSRPAVSPAPHGAAVHAMPAHR